MGSRAENMTANLLNDGYKRIGVGNLTPGNKCLYDIYDKNKKLILRKGQTVPTGELALTRLLEECYIHNSYEKELESRVRIKTAEREQRTLGGKIESLKKKLSLINREFMNKSSDAEKLTYELVDDFRELFENQEPHAIIGHLGLDYSDSSLVRPFHSAAIIEYVADQLNMNEDNHSNLLSAALTNYISILDLQKKLDMQNKELTNEQKKLIRRRSKDSVKILHDAGVRNKFWLGSIYYQEGNSGLFLPADTLKTIDAYSGIVRPRQSIERPANILFTPELKNKLDGHINSEIADILIETIGPYAPGNIVEYERKNPRHMNGPIGLVKRKAQRLETYLINNGDIAISPKYNTLGNIVGVLHPMTLSRYNSRVDVSKIWK